MIQHAQARNIDWRIGLVVACGLMIGSWFGGRWAQHLPEVVARRFFGSAPLVMSLRMLWRR